MTVADFIKNSLQKFINIIEINIFARNATLVYDITTLLTLNDELLGMYCKYPDL